MDRRFSLYWSGETCWRVCGNAASSVPRATTTSLMGVVADLDSWWSRSGNMERIQRVLYPDIFHEVGEGDKERDRETEKGES